MHVFSIAAAVNAVLGLGGRWRWRYRAHPAEQEAGRVCTDPRAERHAARHDALTGLPNRRGFQQIGTALLADSARPQVVVAVVDLDDFTQVNTRYGHTVGDEVLVAVGRRFAAFAGSDLVARLGGDQFAALLTGVRTTEPGLAWVRQRLAAALADPVPVAGGTVAVTASVGLAPLHPAPVDRTGAPRTAADPDAGSAGSAGSTGDPAAALAAMLEQAGAAMHRAKQDARCPPAARGAGPAPPVAAHQPGAREHISKDLPVVFSAGRSGGDGPVWSLR